MIVAALAGAGIGALAAALLWIAHPIALLCVFSFALPGAVPAGVVLALVLHVVRRRVAVIGAGLLLGGMSGHLAFSLSCLFFGGTVDEAFRFPEGFWNPHILVPGTVGGFAIARLMPKEEP